MSIMPTTPDLGLTDVTSVTIPEQKVFDGKPFPLILTPTVKGRDIAGWQDWVKANLTTLKDLLIQYGAILFRDFSLDTAADFDKFTKSFGWSEFPYLGGVSVRKLITGNVYTSSESPPECLIPFHHEMGHFPDFPKVLCAYCETEPAEGGETPLIISNVVYRMMKEREPDFVARLAAEGLRYTRIAPAENDHSSALGRGWKSTFFAEDKETAEQNARRSGFDVEWLPNDCMKYTTPILPAIRVEPRTGKTTWFNSSQTTYFAWQDARNERTRSVFFPNGDFLPDDAMDTLQKVLNEAQVACSWRKGDAAIVDNLLVMHARNHFKPPRCIGISLFKD
jgi:alpha-ketoglutarate-dependent taurine dioxygenase